MKVKSFLVVMEKFTTRAAMLFPTKEFARETKRLADEVRGQLRKQFSLGPYTGDDVLPPAVEMDEGATQALAELCKYLDEHDLGVDYARIAQSA